MRGRYIVNSLCIPDKDHDLPFGALIAGWGQTAKDGRTSDVINKIYVPIFPLENCQKNYMNLGTIDDDMTCFGGQGGKDSCMGDSGGPLVEKTEQRAYVIGVVSWGIPCAEKTFPTIYTKVTKYIEWIQTNIKYKY
ncbi:unnamed protein product, partial [Medioppia subpectinata]